LADPDIFNLRINSPHFAPPLLKKGGPLWHKAKTGILRRFAACFTDHRDPERIEHTVLELTAQRIYPEPFFSNSPRFFRQKDRMRGSFRPLFALRLTILK
jgi:hypothetical protein